jgi:hypothetical protein
MNLIRICIVFGFLTQFNLLSKAQNYHATNGSAYSGAVALFNNPASGINSVYKWDLNILSLQTTFTTNNISLSNFSYAHPGNAYISYKDGSNSYYGHENLDANLLNFLYKIDEKHAFGIGLRGRMYNHLKSSPIYASDTITSGYGFFHANRTTPYLDEFITHNGWIELNLNYSQVLAETDRSRLTAGITLNISKALSGFNGRINKISFEEFVNSNADTGYNITHGGVGLKYSSNYDLPTQSTLKDLFKNSRKGFGINLGVEYSLYDAAVTDENPHTPTNYSWKFGISLMDLGKNTFTTSTYSGNFYNPANNITDASLSNKFTNIGSITELRDSLATIFTSYDSVGNTFTISRPTRLILNVDRNLGNNFGINGQLNMNFYSTASYTKILTRELNLITITPRLETIAWGLFLPIQYTTQGKFWVGAAFKIGPLTMGLHNIAWFKSLKDLNGGGYLMLSVHPFNKRKIMSRFDCPE